MLRAVVIAVGAILTAIGIALIACGARVPGWQALIFGAIVLLGTLGERWRYRMHEGPLDGRWQSTGERFVDPSSGRLVEVMFDPRTGRRRYHKMDQVDD